ncbi:unnamed protein product [Aphanomyces euteiches]|uniref:START domain-containing protein n=1 Tax=Aphanomyces euteiches TaxID=100861 RepID=A0A6G0XKX7_9STRA|nr:hypothetical protein Ae201684_003791 [Aphanomyces euteiches]KAH9084888.1 hypothetical protein Ae201684P_002123 [Aphanomyces euteiches]KAH9150534.1 hypothetical protein AeRB84_006641 [Aphanomyces euteiches]
MYNRIKKREQRQREKEISAEYSILEAELARLERQLAPDLPGCISPDGMLSWQTVSSVFQRERIVSEINRQKLHRKTSGLQRQIVEMMRLIRHEGPAWSLSPPFTIFHYVTLCADPDSRTMAKEWLAQQMYHNTDRAFANIPQILLPNDEVDEICFLDPYVKFGSYSYDVFPYPLKTVVAEFRHHTNSIWQFDETSLKHETIHNTTLYQTVTKRNNYFTVLVGVFHEADRCVLVVRHIHDDETFPSAGLTQRHDMEWIDLRRLSESETIARSVSHSSQPFNSDGLFSVDQVAKMSNIELPPGLLSEQAKWDAFNKELLVRQKSSSGAAHRRVIDVMAQLQ